MRLTRKAKKDFEIWYWIKYGVSSDDFSNECTFWELDKSMIFGVIVDWADRVNICIEITTDNKKIPTFWVDINNEQVDDVELNNRTEARELAIEKLNEIYNK